MRRDNANKGRKMNQPLKFRSTGSVFKNPKNYAAGYLIEKVGLKRTKLVMRDFNPSCHFFRKQRKCFI